MIGKRNEGCVNALRVAASEQCVLILRVVLEPLVGERRDLVGKVFDPLAIGCGNIDAALVGQEGIVRIVGRVEQILVVEFAKNCDHLRVGVSDRLLRVSLDYLVEAGQRSIVVQIVEVLVAVANHRVEIQRIGVRRKGGIYRLGGCDRQNDGKHKRQEASKRNRQSKRSPMVLDYAATQN